MTAGDANTKFSVPCFVFNKKLTSEVKEVNLEVKELKKLISEVNKLRS